jgi:hypothetical protein
MAAGAALHFIILAQEQSIVLVLLPFLFLCTNILNSFFSRKGERPGGMD